MLHDEALGAHSLRLQHFLALDREIQSIMENKADKTGLDTLETHCNASLLPKVAFQQFLEELTAKEGVSSKEFSERNEKMAQLDVTIEKI